MKRLLYPVYGPDFLQVISFSSTVQRKFSDLNCTNREELKSLIIVISHEIDKDILFELHIMNESSKMDN
jgi:hypothetical protein